MDKETLAKKHPELLAEIQAEAKAEAMAEVKSAAAQEQETALINAAATTTAIVRIVAGENAAMQVSTFAAAGFTVIQMEALAPLLAQNANVLTDASINSAVNKDTQPQDIVAKGGSPVSASRESILAAIQANTPDPINTSVTATNGDAIQTTIDRIGAIGQGA